MLDTVVCFPRLAFSSPGFAPDENLSGTQPNDWSRHEPYQEERCKEPPVSPLPHRDSFVRDNELAGCNRLSGSRSGRGEGEPIPVCQGLLRGPYDRCRTRYTGCQFGPFHGPSDARNIKKRATVKRHSIFLRKECALPDRLDPLREPFGKNWMLVEQITAKIFDTMIRQAGWHSIWMPGSCSRKGLGLTPENATHSALARTLSAIPSQFNAAELDSIQVAKYPGFYVVNVTLRPREVQKYTSVELAHQGHPQVDQSA
jgi:hypothetical protein